MKKKKPTSGEGTICSSRGQPRVEFEVWATGVALLFSETVCVKKFGRAASPECPCMTLKNKRSKCCISE